jgi:glycosyltransferase involved in cell wall biosynthesis
MKMISVIVPCFNAEQTISSLLDSLAQQDVGHPWELIIADNGSDDNTIPIVQGYAGAFPLLRIVSATERKGAGYARNIGAQAAQGDFLAFCDADDVVGVEWLAALEKALDSHEFVVSTLEYDQLNDARLRKLQRNPFRHALLKGRYQPFLPMVAASGLAVAKKLHDSIGGFDDKVRYTEDCDYGWRLQLRGHHPVQVDDAIVHVRLRQTGTELFFQAFDWGEYNALLIKRYRPFGMPTIPKRFAFLAWLRLLRRLPGTRIDTSRDQWLWDVGYRLGEIKGWWRFNERDVALDAEQYSNLGTKAVAAKSP